MDRPAYEGWFCLHRGWRENWLFRGEFSRADAWVWLIENACWRATSHNIKGKSVLLERGQLCASRDRLASTWRWSPSAVERFLARLQTEQMIERETGQGKSVLTICNYAKYQDFVVKAGQVTGQVTGPQKNKGTKEQGSNPSGLEVSAESAEAAVCVSAEEDLFGALPQAVESKPTKSERRAPNKVTFDYAERRFAGITDGDLALWARTYRGIDVPTVLNRIAAWVDSHPQPKSRNLKALITRWLQQDQDSALAPAPHSQRSAWGNGRAPLRPENFATKDYSAGTRKDGSF